MVSPDAPIGVMDSGVGGISTLAALTAVLPHENFIYFGDTAHNPYGEKSDDEVRELTANVVDYLIERGSKAIVIACNTATSAAADYLRKRYSDISILGIEPALKPAVESYPIGTILVMATPVALRREKYQQLEDRVAGSATVIDSPCPGLASCIEQEDGDNTTLKALLQELIGGYAGEVDAVVLGCTHYIFAKELIADILGPVEFFDGSMGTARNLEKHLREQQLLNESSEAGAIEFLTSLSDAHKYEHMKKMYEIARSFVHAQEA